MKDIKITVVFIVFVLCTALGLMSQNLVLVRTIDLTEYPAAFSVDPLGSVYVVSETGNLIKFDSTGQVVSNPGRKTKSSDWQIDASNPYKVIVFNRDLQLADIYSSQFSKINSIDFTLLETGDICMMCGSYDNAFWTLSSALFKLTRLSEQLTVTTQNDIGLLMDIKMFSPTVLQESSTHVLLAQKGGPAYIFDQYGNLLLRFNDQADYWSLDGDVLYYIINDSLQAYHTKLHENVVLLTNIKNSKGLSASFQWVAVLSGQSIMLFRKKNN